MKITIIADAVSNLYKSISDILPQLIEVGASCSMTLMSQA